MYKFNKRLEPLTNEQLHERAPSIMANQASPVVSDRYRKVNTIDVVDRMRDQGWMPVKARQMNVRKADRVGFCKHEIRFQRMGDTTLSTVGDESIQALLTNSHDRTSCFCFMLGVYRLVCSNGLVVSQGAFSSIRVRHIGFEQGFINHVVNELAENGKLVADKVNEMKGVELASWERTGFAMDAAKLVMPKDNPTAIATDLLGYRRIEDTEPSLWKTFNLIQENVIKGGMRYRGMDENGEYSGRRTSRAIKSIDRDIKVNQGLWGLAEQMLASKKVA